MDPALRLLIENGDPADEVAVLVRLAPGAPLPAGVRPVSRFGQVLTVRTQRRLLPALHAAGGIVSVKAGRIYRPDVEDRPPAGAHGTVTPTDVRRPPDPALPTGLGVIVGMVDFGFDLCHPAFRRPDGSTRVLALWDQQPGPDPAAPNRFGYGRVHDRAAIDAALRSADPVAALRYDHAPADPGGGCHGTATTSVAAGSPWPGGTAGVAPDAELALVHLSTAGPDGPADLGDSMALLEGCAFIREVAAGRPCVVNLSLGRCCGPHDGRTLVEQALDAAVSGPCPVVTVQSGGNYRGRRTHAQGTLLADDRAWLPVEVPSGSAGPQEIDLWYAGADRIAVALVAPDGTGSVVAGPGEDRVLDLDGRRAARVQHRLRDPNNDRNQAVISVLPGAPDGTWRVGLRAVDVLDGRFHAWIERQPTGAQATFPAGTAVPLTDTGTICNGLRTVVVGGYDPGAPERPLAPFSSGGPTVDGRHKPDLLAHAVDVLVARSRPAGTAPDQAWPLSTRMSGTSLAAPHVTGALACLLERADQPARDRVRRVLLSTCDPYRGPDPRRAGNGYLDLPAALAAARADRPDLEAAMTARLNDLFDDPFEIAEGEPIVRDHRTARTGGGVTVRDHRAAPAAGGFSSSGSRTPPPLATPPPAAPPPATPPPAAPPPTTPPPEAPPPTDPPAPPPGGADPGSDFDPWLFEPGPADEPAAPPAEPMPEPEPEPSAAALPEPAPTAGPDGALADLDVTAAEMVDAYVLGHRPDVADRLDDRLTLLAAPYQPVPRLRAGDLLVRGQIGEGRSTVSVLVDGEITDLPTAWSRGWDTEGQLPGRYALVLEDGPMPRTAADRWARRVGDQDGYLPAGQAELRPDTAGRADVTLTAEDAGTPPPLPLDDWIALVRRIESANPGWSALRTAQAMMRTKFNSRAFNWLLPSTDGMPGVAATGAVTAADVAFLAGRSNVALPDGTEIDSQHVVTGISAVAERQAPGSGGAGGTLGKLVQALPAGVTQIDVATWNGDVAGAAAFWAAAKPIPSKGDTQQDYLAEFMPDSDLFGDADGVAMATGSAATGFTFDPTRPLSDNLARYYGTRATPGTGVRWRVHAFCAALGLGLEPNGVSLSTAAAAAIDARVQPLSDWFGRNDYHGLLKWVVLNSGGGLFNPFPRLWVQRANDWRWFADRFKDFVNRRLKTEGATPPVPAPPGPPFSQPPPFMQWPTTPQGPPFLPGPQTPRPETVEAVESLLDGVDWLARDRRPDLVDRLNALSPGVAYTVDGRTLHCEVLDGSGLTPFDREMRVLVDLVQVTSTRLVDRTGAAALELDSLLASSDLALQLVLIHFLTDLSAGTGEGRRDGFDTVARHLRAVLGDDTIEFGYPDARPGGVEMAVFRSAAEDYRVILVDRSRQRGGRGSAVLVRTPDGQRLTVEQFRARRAAGTSPPVLPAEEAEPATFCARARAAATGGDAPSNRLLELLGEPATADDTARIERRVRDLTALFSTLDPTQKATLSRRLNDPADALSRFFDCELHHETRRRLRQLLVAPPARPTPAPPAPAGCRREPGAVSTLLPWERSLLALVNDVDEQEFDGAAILVGPIFFPGLVSSIQRTIVETALRHGYAITIERTMWFPTTIDTSRPMGLGWLAHESVHMLDYNRAGLEAFLTSYVVKAAAAGFRHDDITDERRADTIGSIAIGLLNRFPDLARLIARCDGDAVLAELRSRRGVYRQAVTQLLVGGAETTGPAGVDVDPGAAALHADSALSAGWDDADQQGRPGDPAGVPVGLGAAVHGDPFNTWLAAQARAAGGHRPPPSVITEILHLVKASTLTTFHWNDRGVAPIGYLNGMALTYARVYCAHKGGMDGLAKKMVKGVRPGANSTTDAVARYAKKFMQFGADVSMDGVHVLRAIFTILFGLGMRESGGKFCAGWDRSKLELTPPIGPTSTNSEAGIFQVSYDIAMDRGDFEGLYNRYKSRPNGFLDVFQQGVTCTVPGSDGGAIVGAGEGRKFQQFNKDCPAFTAELAALAIRTTAQHFGPINTDKVEIRRECWSLLLDVENAVDNLGDCLTLD